MLKFGIYTTFYNCERFVDKIFTSIELLNYDNFEWHITDDYSTDNTKNLVLERLEKSPLKNKIGYYEQSEKKQMYWKPNEFFDETFDWIILMDADDDFDYNFLNIYNNFLYGKDDITLISSDCFKVYEETKSLHSMSYLLNDDIISNKIKRYHPSCDYLNNVSYSCFGLLRGFKNIIPTFEVDDMLACAEDSYHVFWANSFGKYLHIPRPL
jgi:glycosyltransferase involved in cell wall biosynthesis